MEDLEQFAQDKFCSNLINWKGFKGVDLNGNFSKRLIKLEVKDRRKEENANLGEF